MPSSDAAGSSWCRQAGHQGCTCLSKSTIEIICDGASAVKVLEFQVTSIKKTTVVTKDYLTLKISG